MDERRFNWMGRAYVLMPALEKETCSGCHFENDREYMCPNTGPGGAKYCYTPEPTTDYIVIVDDPAYIADYVEARLGLG